MRCANCFSHVTPQHGEDIVNMVKRHKELLSSAQSITIIEMLNSKNAYNTAKITPSFAYASENSAKDK